MSARQAFIPRTPSCAPLSEPHLLPADAHEGDEDRGMLPNGKPRSVVAFLGQKRGTGANPTTQGSEPAQGFNLVRPNTGMNRRSFEGIRRPEMTPMSIIPYPATAEQLGAGARYHGTGQTPRKVVGPGTFAFPRPMTPMSIPRGPKDTRVFAENQDETTSSGNAHRNVIGVGPGGDDDVRVGAGAGIAGYMRAFEGPENVRSAGGAQPGLEHGIAAPVPGYTLGGLNTILGNEGRGVDGIFMRSSRSQDEIAGTEVGAERSSDPQRTLIGKRRGMYLEGSEEEYADEDRQLKGLQKRMKTVQHDPNEYYPISSPHIPPTPALPDSSAGGLDPSLVASSLFENIEDFVNLEEIEADWKRWKECTTEEWLKGADELVQEYSDILNLVKDHMTEKVLAYASMISSVEERRTQVNRNIEVIQREGNIVRENISQLGTKK